MEFTNVGLKVENRVGYVVITHPPANALNGDTFDGLNACLDYILEQDEIKVVVITGAGKFFVAGADIKEFHQAFGDGEKGRQLAEVGQRVFDRMEQFRKPIIAAINGACLGGGFELALGCHMRIAAEEAMMGLPELKLGLIPGFAGTQRLARILPKSKTIELLLTSEFMTGREAERLGLVNYAVPLEEVLPKAKQLAEAIATEKGMCAIAAALQAVNQGLNRSFEEGQALEAELFGKMFLTEDAKEGITAFVEKRKPQFTDR
ncbi:enoyl-CoA hydratase [Ammoniphilus sp. CFH 90114]|uniref:enoyl-CoA hydratase n=1 Tax=Ammoniphilus sp. CFH 90114 TaxID=2493665 RepID=UPI00100EBB18|nr:enoyl-CoA hydratase [Ammoniphilus sp. CFH 90114]RXT14649.1 enoyl-CoA hydratase [Ammoniphilus sp. CFH 90114]